MLKKGWHEDITACMIGLTVVALALAVTWQARPFTEAGIREQYPKGWPTPLAQTVGKPGAWVSAPQDAFRGKTGGIDQIGRAHV